MWVRIPALPVVAQDGGMPMQYLAYSIAVLLALALILLPRELRQRALPASPLLGSAYIVFVAHYKYRANIGGILEMIDDLRPRPLARC